MAWPNAPSGGTLMSDHAFNTRDGNGFVSVYPAGGRIITDTGDPESPPNVYEEFWHHNGTGNAAVQTLSFSAQSELWVGFTWKPSNPFTGWANQHNKIVFLWTAPALIYMSMQGPQRGPYSFWWSLSQPGVSNGHLPGWGDNPGSWNLAPNITSGSIALGVWHRVEIYAKQSTTGSSKDGVLRYWLNNTLVGSYSNINLPGGWTQVQVVPSWDAPEPNYPDAYDYHRFGHIRVVNPAGTIGPTPTPPTISSFTPTSGTYGTPVTIIGSNFDPNPSGNSVSINNVACTVLGAQATQINTAVPNTATTGRVRVTTAQGTATSTTDFTVTDPPPTGAGLLTGSRSTPSATTLSTEGTLDWAHWGLTTASSFTSKSGATIEISDVTLVGTDSKNRYTDNPTAYTWTGGTPTATASATTTGLYTNNAGNGFSFTVPADTTERLLRVYSGCYNATMRLRAVLSDNSAAAYQDSTFTVGAVAGGGNAVWTLRYRAGEAGQTLTTTVSVVSGSNVQLQAATLQLANQPTEAITLSPSSLTVTASDDPDVPGQDGTLTLSINPVRATATVVALASSDAAVVSVPGSVTIPADTASVFIPITGLTAGSAVITATLGAQAPTATVTVIEEPATPTTPATPSLHLYTSFLDVYRWM